MGSEDYCSLRYILADEYIYIYLCEEVLIATIALISNQLPRRFRVLWSNVTPTIDSGLDAVYCVYFANLDARNVIPLV